MSVKTKYQVINQDGDVEFEHENDRAIRAYLKAADQPLHVRVLWSDIHAEAFHELLLQPA